MECKIFLASLTAHTNGIIDGEWIDLTNTRALENLGEMQLEAYEAIIYELGWEREEALNTAENWEFDAIE